MSRVLVVEDEAHLAQGLRFNLEAEGYSVHVADRGEEALALLLQQKEVFDALILDVMLPDINGKAVCELVKQDPTMSDIKIICISGLVEEDKIEELKEADL